MGGKLSVKFELDIADAKAQGVKAGEQFSQGFASGLSAKGRADVAQWTSKMGAAAAANMRAQLGISANPINAPGLAPGADVFARMLNMGPMIKPMTGGFAKQFEISMGMGGQQLKGAARDAYEKFWKNAIPPLLSPAGGNSGLGKLLLGIGAAPFSSWVGARMMSEGAFGGGKGGGGGLLGKGGAAGFAEFFIGIEALKKAFDYGSEKIKQVVDRGFELYTRSAQLRRSVGQLFSIQEAGQQVGLNQDQIDQFMLRNNWGKARTSLQNFGVFSQLGGMSKDFQDAFKWASEISGVWDRNARTTYEIHMNFDRIKTDWLTMWNDSSFLRGVDILSGALDKLLHVANRGGGAGGLLAGMVPGLGPWWTAVSTVGLFGKGGAGQDLGNGPVFPLKQTLPQMGQLEKMGFVISGGRDDAKNRVVNGVEEIKRILMKMSDKLGPGSGAMAAMGAGAIYTGMSGGRINPP